MAFLDDGVLPLGYLNDQHFARSVPRSLKNTPMFFTASDRHVVGLSHSSPIIPSRLRDRGYLGKETALPSRSALNFPWMQADWAGGGKKPTLDDELAARVGNLVLALSYFRYIELQSHTFS